MAIANPTLTCTNITAQNNTGLKCLKPANTAGEVFATCAKWRLFYPNCPAGNSSCNPLGGAWVAAVTVCTQRLF